METNRPEKRYTIAGTDIEEVKRQNRNSGLSYNEAKELLAERWLAENKINENK